MLCRWKILSWLLTLPFLLVSCEEVRIEKQGFFRLPVNFEVPREKYSKHQYWYAAKEYGRVVRNGFPKNSSYDQYVFIRSLYHLKSWKKLIHYSIKTKAHRDLTPYIVFYRIQALNKTDQAQKAYRLLRNAKKMLKRIPYPDEINGVREEILAQLGLSSQSKNKGLYLYYRYMKTRHRPLLIRSILRGNRKAISLLNRRNLKRVFKSWSLKRRAAKILYKKKPLLAAYLYQKLGNKKMAGKSFFRANRCRLAQRYLPDSSSLSRICRLKRGKAYASDIRYAQRNIHKKFYAKKLLARYTNRKQWNRVYQVLVRNYQKGYLRHVITGLLTKKHYTKLKQYLSKLITRPLPKSEEQMLLYWLGYLHLLNNNKDKADKVLSPLAQKSPFSFYGWQAFLLMGEPERIVKSWQSIYLINKKKLAPYLNRVKKFRFDYRDKTALFFLKIGEHSKGFKILRRRYIKLANYSIGLIRFFKSIRRPDMSVHFASIFYKTISKKTGTHLFYSNLFKELFPVAYRSLIKKSSKKFKIGSALLTAVIRQESRFYRNARSWVGARGLMQLMPSTGRPIIRKLYRKGTVKNRRITSPHTNIMAGSTYLNWLLDGVYKNYPSPYRTILSIASYNAGPRRIKKLYQSFSYLIDPNVFIESIYLNETRHYVKRVLMYQEIYHYLYGLKKHG